MFWPSSMAPIHVDRSDTYYRNHPLAGLRTHHYAGESQTNVTRPLACLISARYLLNSASRHEVMRLDRHVNDRDKSLAEGSSVHLRWILKTQRPLWQDLESKEKGNTACTLMKECGTAHRIQTTSSDVPPGWSYIHIRGHAVFGCVSVRVLPAFGPAGSHDRIRRRGASVRRI
jgi:hypothetical protein